MAPTALVAALFLVVATVHASQTDMAASVPELMVKSLFEALETRVLEMHEDFGAEWLECYELSSTKDSVDNFEQFWLEEPANASHVSSATYIPRPEHFLVDVIEALMEGPVDILSWEAPATSPQEALVRMIKKRVNEGSLFLEMLLVRYAVLKTLLCGQFGQDKFETLRSIFSRRFLYSNYLTEIGQFIDELAQVKDSSGLLAVCVAYCNNSVVLNVLTELSYESPELIAALVRAHVKGNARSHEGSYVNVRPLLFKRLSPECQSRLAATLDDWELRYMGMRGYDSYVQSEAPRSPLEQVRELLVEREADLANEGDKAQQNSEMIGKRVGCAWRDFEHEIGRSGCSMSPESYLDLYIQCCRATGYVLALYQLPGMADDKYAELMRGLIERHQAVPSAPMRSLKWDHERLIQVLVRNSNLIGPEFQKDVHGLDRLVVYLFSTRRRAPPELVSALSKESALYALLFDGDGSAKTLVNTSLWSYFVKPDRELSPHGVIEMCILLEPQNDPEMLGSLEKAIGESCRMTDVPHHEGLNLIQMLGADIMRLLCSGRRNYDVQEIKAVERVFMQCKLWDDTHKRAIFSSCIRNFVRNPEFTIKYVGRQ